MKKFNLYDKSIEKINSEDYLQLVRNAIAHGTISVEPQALESYELDRNVEYISMLYLQYCKMVNKDPSEFLSYALGVEDLDYTQLLGFDSDFIKWATIQKALIPDFKKGLTNMFERYLGSSITDAIEIDKGKIDSLELGEDSTVSRYGETMGLFESSLEVDDSDKLVCHRIKGKKDALLSDLRFRNNNIILLQNPYSMERVSKYVEVAVKSKSTLVVTNWAERSCSKRLDLHRLRKAVQVELKRLNGEPTSKADALKTASSRIASYSYADEVGRIRMESVIIKPTRVEKNVNFDEGRVLVKKAPNGLYKVEAKRK